MAGDPKLDAFINTLIEQGESDDVIREAIKQWTPSEPANVFTQPVSQSIKEGLTGAAKHAVFDVVPGILSMAKDAALSLGTKPFVDDRMAREGLLDKAVNAPTRSEQIGYGLSGLIPFVGPMLASAGESIGSGNPERMGAGAVDAAMLLEGGSPTVRGASRAATGAAAGAVGRTAMNIPGVATVAPYVRDAAKNPLTAAAGGIEGYKYAGWPGAVAGTLGAPMGKSAVLKFLRDTIGARTAPPPDAAAKPTKPSAPPPAQPKPQTQLGPNGKLLPLRPNPTPAEYSNTAMQPGIAAMPPDLVAALGQDVAARAPAPAPPPAAPPRTGTAMQPGAALSGDPAAMLLEQLQQQVSANQPAPPPTGPPVTGTSMTPGDAAVPPDLMAALGRDLAARAPVAAPEPPPAGPGATMTGAASAAPPPAFDLSRAFLQDVAQRAAQLPPEPPKPAAGASAPATKPTPGKPTTTAAAPAASEQQRLIDFLREDVQAIGEKNSKSLRNTTESAPGIASQLADAAEQLKLDNAKQRASVKEAIGNVRRRGPKDPVAVMNLIDTLRRLNLPDDSPVGKLMGDYKQKANIHLRAN